MRKAIVIVLAALVFVCSCSFFQRRNGESGGSSGSAAAAPSDSPFPNGRASIPRPSDKQAGIAWAQGCPGSTAASPDANSYVKIWWLRLDGVTASGQRRQLALDTYTSNRAEGERLYRDPWGLTVPGSTLENRFEDGALLLPVGNRPEHLYHPWNVALSPEVWRTALPSDIVAIVSAAELQCFGDARAQIGADYWQSVNSPPGTQSEAWVSGWVDASAGRVVLEVSP